MGRGEGATAEGPFLRLMEKLSLSESNPHPKARYSSEAAEQMGWGVCVCQSICVYEYVCMYGSVCF